MQSIVADTTPLNYLVLIQAADILPNLYRKVFIPPAVRAELAHANTPAIVRAWISRPPQWLEVVSLKQPIDSALAHLDAGEREAISLASELQAILLLMDERDGSDYSSAAWIEGGRHARCVGPCCSPRTG
jgi:predicted nucleic acid-binding protein